MEVHFTPQIQAKLEHWATSTGRPADELLQDDLAGYFDELASTRDMLESRYDDLKSGRVKLVTGAASQSAVEREKRRLA